MSYISPKMNETGKYFRTASKNLLANITLLPEVILPSMASLNFSVPKCSTLFPNNIIVTHLWSEIMTH